MATLAGSPRYVPTRITTRTLIELERDMEDGCLQQMSLDPYAPGCGAPVECINCAACDEHCHCPEPVYLSDITEGMEA